MVHGQSQVLRVVPGREMSQAVFLTRALDVLESLLDATPQAGPGPLDFDVDLNQLANLRQQARVVLYTLRGRV